MIFGLGRPSPDGQRAKALKCAPAGALRDYLEVPLPDPATPVDHLPLLALDLETTSLDPRTGHVLSVGMVPIDNLSITLSGARRMTVAARTEVGQSATIHGLTDDAVAAGLPPQVALEAVLEALRGRVLLAHYTDLEQGFLSQACERIWGQGLPVARVDTLELQRRLIVGWGDAPVRLNLRLWSARERYGLPVYRAHDALQDAIACAELFLGQVAEMQAKGPVTLKRIAS